MDTETRATFARLDPCLQVGHNKGKKEREYQRKKFCIRCSGRE